MLSVTMWGQQYPLSSLAWAAESSRCAEMGFQDSEEPGRKGLNNSCLWQHHGSLVVLANQSKSSLN